MATTTPSTALVPVAPMFTNTERLALAGFLAGYSGEPGPPSPAAYAPSPGSTGTPSKKNSSSTHPLRMSAVPGWIMSPTPPGWTVTNSARS
jgi:hypothetical protein